MMIPAERDKTPYSTLCVALSVLILITSVIAPLRLPFLLIPLSFFLAAYGMGLLLEKAIPSIASSVSMLTLVVRLGTGISLLGCATAVLGLMGLYRLTALRVGSRASGPIARCIELIETILSFPHQRCSSRHGVGHSLALGNDSSDIL
jgi:hypothetical protein